MNTSPATRSPTRKSAARPSRYKVYAAAAHWSNRVSRHSHALDIENGVFNDPDAKTVARSLKRSAEKSRRRNSDPFRSAMSMLNFYINRARKKLPKKRLDVLQRAKSELREMFQRPRA